MIIDFICIPEKTNDHYKFNKQLKIIEIVLNMKIMIFLSTNGELKTQLKKMKDVGKYIERREK